jgi:hypothetical protein
VLQAAFISSELTSGVGRIAAAIAIDAFIGKARPSSIKASDREWRRDTALGGFFGMGAMIILILLSASGW